MALDATVATTTANSYLTVDDADGLAATDAINGAKWLAAQTADKEVCLMQATVDVDVFKGAVGTAYATDQALRFPRAVDLDGSDLPYIVRPVARATYEQAVHLLANRKLIADAQAHRAQGTLSQQDANGAWQAALDPRFGRYALGMIEQLGTITAVIRAGGRQLVSVTVGNELGA